MQQASVTICVGYDRWDCRHFSRISFLDLDPSKGLDFALNPSLQSTYIGGFTTGTGSGITQVSLSMNPLSRLFEEISLAVSGIFSFTQYSNSFHVNAPRCRIVDALNPVRWVERQSPMIIDCFLRRKAVKSDWIRLIDKAMGGWRRFRSLKKRRISPKDNDRVRGHAVRFFASLSLSLPYHFEGQALPNSSTPSRKQSIANRMDAISRAKSSIDWAERWKIPVDSPMDQRSDFSGCCYCCSYWHFSSLEVE